MILVFFKRVDVLRELRELKMRSFWSDNDAK